MLDSVLLSVIIPTCDRPIELHRCLERLTPNVQGVESIHYEIIVSNDSFSSTALDTLKRTFPLVEFVDGPRKGPAANRNCGARFAKGHWLMFTDDDCVPFENWLLAYVKAIECGDDVLEGKTICSQGLVTPMFEAPINENGGNLWSCNFAIKSKLFKELGGFDERFPFASSEDEMFRESIKRAGKKVKFIPDAIVDHPPRKRPFGKAWSKRWQSQILKERLLETTICTDSWMPIRIAKSRFLELTQVRSISDACWLVASNVIEIACIAWNRRKWNRWAEALINQSE